LLLEFRLSGGYIGLVHYIIQFIALAAFMTES